MSNNTINDDFTEQQQQFIEALSSTLDINIDNIRHIVLSSGVEVIGEVVESDVKIEDDMSFCKLSDIRDEPIITVCNPVRVMVDSYMTEYGAMNNSLYFTNYNPCSDVPFTTFKKTFVLHTARPNKNAILTYLESLHQTYYPINEYDDVADEVLYDEFLKDSEDGNVIDLLPFLNKK